MNSSGRFISTGCIGSGGPTVIIVLPYSLVTTRPGLPVCLYFLRYSSTTLSPWLATNWLNSPALYVRTTLRVAALTQYVPAKGSCTLGGVQLPSPRRLFQRRCQCSAPGISMRTGPGVGISCVAGVRNSVTKKASTCPSGYPSSLRN
jgi:hypothetical protein